jgi:hypothetical protein
MKRGLLGVGFGTVILVVTVLVFGANASALPSGSRLVDRTFGCIPLAVQGVLRATEVNAAPIGAVEAYNPYNEPYDPSHELSPGFIGVASGGWEPGSEFVSIRAHGWRRFGSAYSPEGVYASSRRCAASRASIPLSATGLPGPPSHWAEQATCLGRGRVLIRVRAILQSSASWQPQTDSSAGARSNVVEAAVAVRSERTGKPIAYLELDRHGKTKLWYSASCRW